MNRRMRMAADRRPVGRSRRRDGGADSRRRRRGRRRRPSRSRSTTSRSTRSSPTSRADSSATSRRKTSRSSRTASAQTISAFTLVDIPIERVDRPLFAAQPIEPDVRTNARPFDGRIYIVVLDDLHVQPLHHADGPARHAQVHPGEAGRQRSDGGHSRAGQERRTPRNSPAASGCCSRRSTSSSARPSGRRPSRRTSGTWRPSASPGAGISDPMEQKRGFDARSTLEELQAIADWFGGVRGRKKSILFVSEGIDYDIEDVFDKQRRVDDHGPDARSHSIGDQVERQHLRDRSARADRHGRHRRSS